MPIEMKLLELNPQGSYILLLVNISGNPLLILAWYVPPCYTSTILSEGFTFMSRHSPLLAIWLGDFNMVANHSLDRMRQELRAPQPDQVTRLSRLLADFALIDT